MTCLHIQRSEKGKGPQTLDKGEGTRQARKGSGSAVSAEAAHHHRATCNAVRKPFMQIQEPREQGQECKRSPSPHRAQISPNREYRAPEERAINASVSHDLALQLERLAALHDTGSLTPAEFGTAKQVECSRRPV
jgi:hypothetical protein